MTSLLAKPAEVRENFQAAATNEIAAEGTTRPKRKRPTPFAIRLTKDERAQLEAEAAGAPLGTYIKAKALGAPPLRMRRNGLPMADRQSFARALGMLGQSRLSSNLNQLTRLANTGSLPFTPEIEDELRAALNDVRAIRRLLMEALGLKPGDPG